MRLTLALTKEKCNAPAWKIEELFEHADHDIDLALRALGYYHATVEKSLVFNEDCWQAGFKITPRKRVTVKEVDVRIDGDARDDPEFAKLLQNLPLKPGDPLHHGRYESIKNKLESLALENGYMQAAFTEKKLLINKKSKTAEIMLKFDTGKRMVFGDIAVEQDILDAEFIKNYLTIKSGEVYSSEQLALTHNALSGSGYFETVDIRSDLEHAQDQRVPITIKLTPKVRSHYGLGFGFDTDIGPLINASYINRRINKYGHFFTSNIDLSPVLSTAEAEYSIPLKKTTDFLSIGGGLKREDTKTFDALTATLSARYKHAYQSGWKQVLFLDYSYEDFKTDSDSGQISLLASGGNWLISVANDPIRPTEGYRVELEAKGGLENPISDVSFVQGYLSATWLHQLPLGGKFIGRTQQGATLVDRVTQLPASYRFYAGGINSVRGYNYKELGPKDKSGNVEGGKYLSVFSAEYEQSVLDNWGIAAFVDTGNAFNLEAIRFNTGVGIGVRWYSPVGPVRLDFAVPLNDADSSFQVHFAAGGRL